MPDWLLELMPAAEGEEPRQKAVAEDRQVMPLRADTQAEPYTKPQEAAPADVDGLDDLRHQVAVQEAAQVMAAQKAHSPYVFGGLLPWQAFFPFGAAVSGCSHHRHVIFDYVGAHCALSDEVQRKREAHRASRFLLG